MKQILFFLMFIVSLSKGYGQIICGSELNLPLIQQNNPARYNRILQLEQHTQNYINSVNNGNNSARLLNPNATIIIPVVVHVLHRGEAVGVGRNISDAQIQSQIDVLNEDFRRLNADAVNTPGVFQGVAADANFEFRLACIDPNGNATNGITRTFAGVNQFNPLGNINPSDGSFNEQAIGIKFTNAGGINAWPTNRYLNIWVCDMAGGLIGYGQFPDEYSVKPNTDGVVMLFNAFGRVGNLLPNFNQGRVCVHEIGHWLNLRHIWGDANCGNDFVDDTPPQASPNWGCPAFPHITCNNGPNGDMFMNYMDYTNNGCQNIYTRGQSLRMRAVFAQRGGPRASFIENYFNIIPPSSNFCISGSLSLFNPNCLPVTWDIVSGPAVITSGQGTNTINIQKTGDGIAVVRATSGSYIDEQEVVMGPSLVTIAGPYDPVQHTIMGVACVGEQYYFTPFEYFNSNDSYTWTLFPPVGSNENIRLFSGWQVQFDFYVTGYHILRVTKTNSCGSTSTDMTINVQECFNNFRLTVSPNPATSQITASIDDESNQVKALGADTDIKFEIYNFNTGSKQKQWKYKNNQSQFTLNLSGLNKGVYILKASKGKYSQSIKVILN